MLNWTKISMIRISRNKKHIVLGKNEEDDLDLNKILKIGDNKKESIPTAGGKIHVTPKKK